MVTFATQKLRIATEMVRGDLASGGELETVLEQHYQDAVEYYANEKFWFNTLRTTANTVAATATITVPTTIRRVERVVVDAYDRELVEVTLANLPDDDSTGVPSRYAYYNDTLRLWPTPDAIYTLVFYGIAKVAAPTAAADDSIWTNEAAPLIRAHTKMSLYRGIFRDATGIAMAAAEASDAHRRLLRETARRLETPIRAQVPVAAYNINIE